MTYLVPPEVELGEGPQVRQVLHHAAHHTETQARGWWSGGHVSTVDRKVVRRGNELIYNIKVSYIIYIAPLSTRHVGHLPDLVACEVEDAELGQRVQPLQLAAMVTVERRESRGREEEKRRRCVRNATC